MRSQRHVFDIHGEDANGWDGRRIASASPSSIEVAPEGTDTVDVLLVDAAGNPIVGATIGATSTAVGVATVLPASDTTDANGEVTFTVTGVADGVCMIRYTTAGAANPTAGYTPVAVVTPEE